MSIHLAFTANDITYLGEWCFGILANNKRLICEKLHQPLVLIWNTHYLKAFKLGELRHYKE